MNEVEAEGAEKETVVPFSNFVAPQTSSTDEQCLECGETSEMAQFGDFCGKEVLTLSNFGQPSFSQHFVESVGHDQPVTRKKRTHPNQSWKRIRTSFGRTQLDTLREAFKRSHKPNSAQLCALIARTGLTKRVIQVS